MFRGHEGGRGANLNQFCVVSGYEVIGCINKTNIYVVSQVSKAMPVTLTCVYPGHCLPGHSSNVAVTPGCFMMQSMH